MGERRGLHRVYVGKLEGKIPLGRPRLRWEDNIKMDLQEVGCGGMDWIDQAHDRDTMSVVLYGCETWSVTLREELGCGCLRIGC